QGNHYRLRDHGPGAFHRITWQYWNRDGSFYYTNPDGSTYWNDGKGKSRFDPLNK
ncbi:hypothetical protein GQ44DRAFT_626991, partial [Phaeosphaeriaceae sp. PMI808]